MPWKKFSDRNTWVRKILVALVGEGKMMLESFSLLVTAAGILGFCQATICQALYTSEDLPLSLYTLDDEHYTKDLSYAGTHN